MCWFTSSTLLLHPNSANWSAVLFFLPRNNGGSSPSSMRIVSNSLLSIWVATTLVVFWACTWQHRRKVLVQAQNTSCYPRLKREFDTIRMVEGEDPLLLLGKLDIAQE